MKTFVNNNYRLSRTPIEIRVIYTIFLIFILIGHISIIIFQFSIIGFSYEDIVTRYLGSESDEELAFPMPMGQLLEETHIHAFIEGVVLLILGHLLIATTLKKRFRYILIFILSLCAFLDLALPWLIRYIDPHFAIIKLISWSIFDIGLLLIIFLFLLEIYADVLTHAH